MKLHNSKQEFIDVITAASNHFNVHPAIIEKDYYVTLILKELSAQIPGILFKGGTCLSKCFNVINRFSEDIDLSLDASHFTQSNKRNANKTVIRVCDTLGFIIDNRNQVEKHSHGTYNCYNIQYPHIFSNAALKDFIKLEMVFIQKAYPDTIRPVHSIIEQYLKSSGYQNIVNDFDLQPFDIIVQSLERTFVDKVFALCDYYLRKEELRQSRHIYDLKMLSDNINIYSLNTLIKDVRNDRLPNKTCLSAKDGIVISDILKKIVDEEYFKKDYEKVTIPLLSSKVSYNEAIGIIKTISENKIFDSCI